MFRINTRPGSDPGMDVGICPYRADRRSEYEKYNQVYSRGQCLIEIDTGMYKVGDGESKYKDLPYFTINVQCGCCCKEKTQEDMMEDRAKELAKEIELRIDGKDRSGFMSIPYDMAREIADLLDPPQYPCNGELVEFVDLDGSIGVGYANNHGVKRWKEDGITINWHEIKGYRVIREAREFVPHPGSWLESDRHVVVESRFNNDSYYRPETTVTISQPEAEEIHKELK